jgi:hypothetical protein
VMLVGLGHQPVSHLPVLDQLDESEARAAFTAIKDRTGRLLGSLPSQFEYLTQMRAAGGITV